MFLFISFQSLTATGAGGTGKIAYAVAEHLHKQEHVVKLVVSSKGKFKTDFESVPVSVFSRYYLFFFNTLIAPFLTAYRKRYLEELIFDFFCSQHVKRDQKLLFTTTPFIPRTLQKAKKLNIPVIFFPGTPEENHIAEIVTCEKMRWKVETTDVYTYAPRLSVFNKGVALTDYIFCHSSVIESTFRKQWPDKKFISCRGLLKPSGAAVQVKDQPQTFKVVYAAHTVLLKGLQYLLKAWREQNLTGELLVLGGIDAAVMRIIETEFPKLDNVTFIGHVSGIDSYLKEASVLICPSMIDGGPVTVLEAMQYGVSSILTEDCGVKDVIEDGRTGWIISSGNSKALAEKLFWCYQNPEELKSMGVRAQHSLQQYDFKAFIENIASETLALHRL